MKLFKRKKEQSLGRGSERVVALSKIFETLNYTPLAYEYTPDFVGFVHNAESDFRQRLSNVSIDDLNVNMFDSIIEGLVNLELAYAKEQYTNHISVVNHMVGLINGELKLADEHLHNLENDKTEVEAEMSKLAKLKDKLNII